VAIVTQITPNNIHCKVTGSCLVLKSYNNNKYKEINLDVFWNFQITFQSCGYYTKKENKQDLLNFRIVSLSSFYFFILVRQEINLSHLVRYKI
jgi:hypothetical protein